MVVRKAFPSEQVKMAQIAAEAFWDDELQGQLILPYRTQHPEDAHLYFLKRIRKEWNDPSSYFLVSTMPTSDGKDEVAAWGQWVRKSAEETKCEAAESNEPNADTLPPNRAADPALEDVLERAYACVLHEWSGSRAECWNIAWIAVAPQRQGEGHGKTLMQWGIERATEEQVALSVIAAKGKDGFYNKLGYTVPSGKLSSGEENPLNGKIEGCQFWWKEDHLASK